MSLDLLTGGTYLLYPLNISRTSFLSRASASTSVNQVNQITSYTKAYSCSIVKTLQQLVTLEYLGPPLFFPEKNVLQLYNMKRSVPRIATTSFCCFCHQCKNHFSHAPTLTQFDSHLIWKEIVDTSRGPRLPPLLTQPPSHNPRSASGWMAGVTHKVA